MQNVNPFVGDTPRQTVKNLASATAVIQAAMSAEARDEFASVGYWGVHLVCNAMMDAALMLVDEVSDRPGGDL